MSLEETKQLIRTFRITPNKLLGQNFLVEPSLYTKLCVFASVGDSDVVLDAGAGFGFLSRFLADKCKAVIAVEKDPQIARSLRQQVKGIGNVTVIEGDALKTALPKFTKVIAVPPYYISTRLVAWLLERNIACAVLILQKEFANRLNAAVGSKDYGWLTVLTYQRLEAELLDAVPKEMFFPQPKVDSVIVRLRPWSQSPFMVKNEALFMQVTKWLFTQRNKKLGKAVALLFKANPRISYRGAENLAFELGLNDKRVRELRPQQFGALADAIAR
ncbi:MAG TPA: 16S rRNA (adenine(1518)-N(6)/adenine(1519)-N(6))-dimethyltransferase RsmA [Candidatus Limnocylindrales bacterium]|nr:16S rRNA (adenine(1518)-N(6)/adenine(1519)-N(6))-dimethyltransferase RsmA [Candidatus Limnocylindrales bacterium]